MLAPLTFPPLPAWAAAAERSYQIRTRIVEEAPSAGEFDGLLRLHISPEGLISGYYRPDDDPRFVAVDGGVTGSRFWIDIGSFATNPRRFSGSFRNGTIEAVGNEPIVDDGRYTTLELYGTPKIASAVN
jgi:hypothetical protein